MSGPKGPYRLAKRPSAEPKPQHPAMCLFGCWCTGKGERIRTVGSAMRLHRRRGSGVTSPYPGGEWRLLGPPPDNSIGVPRPATARMTGAPVDRPNERASDAVFWAHPPQRAAEVALGACGAAGCKVIVSTSPAMCSALVATENGKCIGAASRADRINARLAALANCQKGNAGESAIQLTTCNQ